MHAFSRAILVGAALACGTAPASAQSYPSRSIEMIVPFPAGGITDTMAQAMQNAMSKALAQRVSIANKEGASGTSGLADLARASPDGYTVAFTSNNPLAAQPHVQKVPYRVESFRYVCLSYYTPLVLVAGPQAAFKTAEEFVAFARAKPENLVYGFPGVASQQHLGMLGVLKAIGAKGRGVAFSSGAAALRALFDGSVMAIIETPGVATATDFTVLAALSEERIGTLPAVRTMKEVGYPATASLYGGIIAPAGVSPEAADRLEKACAEATASADYKGVAERTNLEARHAAGEAFRKMIEADWAANGETLARAGLATGK
jgi:tripartite-type tricarboxylate transporter receptor subunit TctC